MLLQSGLKFRNFAQQSAFSFDLDLSLSSSSGYSTFGISGSGGACDLFKFKNGMVYDPLGRFVYSYSPSESLNISGSFNSGALGYYINSNPIALNVNAYNSTGLFDTIYFSTLNSDINFEVDVYGYKLPTYNFIFNDSSFLTGSNIIGNILNTSADNRSSFRVFSGFASFGYTGYKFQSVLSNSIIYPSKSGTFSFNYSGDGSDYTVSSSTGVEPLSYNINLYTDFGLINKTGVIDLGYSPLYFTDFYLESSGYANNEYLKNYYLEGKVCDNSAFVFKLEKISGFDYVNNTTGSLNFTGIATGIVSGHIYGTGFLNGQVKGQNFISTQADYYGNPVILSGFTGVHSGNLSYGTGFIDASGYSVVDSFSGSVFGSGFINKITNNVYTSTQIDSVSKNYISSSGSFIDGVANIITGAKASGEAYLYFIPGQFYITNPNPDIIPVSGIFTGQNTSEVIYTGLVSTSGDIYSPSNYSLNFSGVFEGIDPTGGLIVQNLMSGVNYANSTLSTGILGSGPVSFTGTPYIFYTGYDYIYPYPDPTHLGVDAVYKYTGYFPNYEFSGASSLPLGFSGVTSDGKYKAGKKNQTFIINPSSGSSVIDNIKINQITGLKSSSVSLKLKDGVDGYLTENSDVINFNTGFFNLPSQGMFAFKYKKNSYNPSSNSEFSGISDLVYKVNTFHSNWISGSYNNSTRVLEFYSPTGIGYSGNYMYMQPVIKSGINNFFDSSFNFSTSGFYFTGGETYFLNMNTGVSGFHSGVFATGTGSATGDVYFHKTEYQSVYKKQVPYLVESYASNFFTGYTSTSYSGYNSYSSLSYASGNMTYNYSVSLTGFASGYNSLTNNSGVVTGIINKTGQLTTQAISGVGIWNNIALTGSGSAGQVYVIPKGGSQYTEVSNYWYGDFVGLFNFNITNSGYYSISTGVSASITTGSKWIDYDARYDYNFNIKTGAFSNDGLFTYSGVSVPYNSGSNMYSGSGILNSTSCLPFNSSPSRYVKFEIRHYNPYNSGNNIMKYTISGTTGSYLFTGLIKE